MVEDKKYYVYRHIRLDTNVPFYIGIGTYRDKYNGHVRCHKRAYTKDSRNKWWTNIVNKTNYKVEILFYSNSLEDIKQKEIEFIKLYGRKDLGTGILVNLTDGGDFSNKVSIKSNIPKIKTKLNVKDLYYICEYNLNGKLLSKTQLKDFKIQFNLNTTSKFYNFLRNIKLNQLYLNKKYKIYNTVEDILENIEPHIKYKMINKRPLRGSKPNPKKCKQVYQYDLENNLINIHITKDLINKTFGETAYKGVSRCALGRNITYKGYKWSYTPLESNLNTINVNII